MFQKERLIGRSFFVCMAIEALFCYNSLILLCWETSEDLMNWG